MNELEIKKLAERIKAKGKMVFYNPKPLHSYEYLAEKSLGSNTYRGFHRIDTTKQGSKAVFVSFFLQNKEMIIKRLNKVKNEDELHEFGNEVCKTLISKLSNIKSEQLESFNKTRKPVDIMFEHMISMGNDFSEIRNTITEFLFLPLDSQMFQSEFVFNDSEIEHLKIDRKYTFTNIKTEAHYLIIQKFLKLKAKKLGLKARILFDLEWNKRYESDGSNLFLTNPKIIHNTKNNC